ncbi:hypothetical protein DXA70_05060 [Faecalibacterium sp. OF04-11AC]|nr:hypothetical protein DXA70_05060 [Faecalibacterium sp. OF04-11AC]
MSTIRTKRTTTLCVALRGGDIIAKKATTIAIVNQKGGTAKTTTCENLGIGLAMGGKKVLLVDVDPQAHSPSVWAGSSRMNCPLRFPLSCRKL